MAKLPVIILLLLQITILLLSSCSKEQQTAPIKVRSDIDPSMSADNIDVLFSDSGKIEARLTAPLLHQFSGQNPRMEFPKGFKLYTYDSLLREKFFMAMTWNRTKALPVTVLKIRPE